MTPARPHVLFLCSRLVRDGTTVQLLNVLHHLGPGFRTTVAALSSGCDATLVHALRASGAAVTGFDRATLALASAARDLKGAAADADLIVSFGIRADLLNAVVRHGRSRAAILHNVPSLDYVMLYGRLKGRLMAAAHRAAVARLDTGIAVSRTVANHYAGFVRHVRTIPNGIDTDHFRPIAPSERELQRATLGVPASCRLAVAVGGLIARKNHQTLIEAMARASLPDTTLAILGEGPDRLAMEALARAAGVAVELPGKVDVRPWLQAADLFLSASRAEGLPNAVMEAAACGLPLLLSDIPPHRELLATMPEGGLLFAPDNPADAARLLPPMLERPVPDPYIRAAAEATMGAAEMGRAYAALFRTLV